MTAADAPPPAASGPSAPASRRRDPRSCRGCCGGGGGLSSSTSSSPAPIWAPRETAFAATRPTTTSSISRRGGCTGASRWLARRRTRTTGPRSTCSSCATDASSAASTAAAPEARWTGSIRCGARRSPCRPTTSRRGRRFVWSRSHRSRRWSMAPFVAVWGLAFNDVLFTALWAALNPMLLFLLLRHLRARGLSRRTDADDLWLTALFGVGSVYYFCAVVGQVWFTAQIVAVTLSIAYVWASLEAATPSGPVCSSGSGSRRGPPGWCFPCLSSKPCGRVVASRRSGSPPPGASWLGRWRNSWLPSPPSVSPCASTTTGDSRTRSSSAIGSWRSSGRSGSSATGCSTITSCHGTSPPRWCCCRGS